jgi:signal peptidase II
MIYGFLILAALLLDQGTKWWAETWLSQRSTFPVIPDVFHLTYCRNTGAAFSILRNKQMLLVLVTSGVMVVLGLWLIRLIQKGGPLSLKLSLAMILAGGVGNLIDRVRLNYVIDFLDFRLIHFAVFNVADSLIVIGTLLLAWHVLFRKG